MHSAGKFPVFKWLQKAGNVAQSEMYRTFNCGIGMVVCVPAEHEQTALSLPQSRRYSGLNHRADRILRLLLTFGGNQLNLLQ